MIEDQLFLQGVSTKTHQQRMLIALRRIMRAVSIYSRKLKAEHGITSPQLISLICIAEQGPLSISAISEMVHLSASTVVGIVDRLEEKKYVTRARSENDRRRMDVTVTEAGLAIISSAPSLLQDRFAENLDGLSEFEKITITLSLEKVVALMEAHDIDASPILDTGPSMSRNG